MKFQLKEKQIEQLLIAILITGMFFILSDLFKNISFPDSSYNFLGKDKRVELEPGKSVTQVFKARRDGLDQIKIIIGDLGSLGIHDSIDLTLAQSNCETPIATDTITSFTGEPKIYYHFDFDRIPDSLDKSYCLKISYSATERKKERPYLRANEGELFAHTAYFDDARSKFYEGRSLQMRPSYSNISFSQNLHELENRLSQYKPAFMKGSVLILGLTVVLTSTLFGIIIIRTKDE